MGPLGKKDWLPQPLCSDSCSGCSLLDASPTVAYFVGAALAPTESWRLILSLSAIPAVIVLALIVRLPDTARWLLMNGQRE